MKKLNNLFLFILSIIIVSSASAQTKLVEEVKAVPGKAVIAYKKYQLPNGLTLIVHEDHSDPIVHVECTYHVGSARETPRRSGFAHFFEHMMFQGSENVADEQHFKIVNEAGGVMNGTTNRDRTNYFETLPSNKLETALWLEADRMGFLLNAFTQEKFEVQRKTVKNEKDQRYNRPYGMLGEVKDQLLYPYGHSYSWPVIGFVDDLNEADSADLRNFFLKWYGPNNAILVVSGDVNTDEVVKLTEKYFGPIKRGTYVPKQVPKRVILPEAKLKAVGDDVIFPLTQMVFPTPQRLHKDEAALDLLSSLMAGGKNSIFYKKFVDSEHALQASISNPTSELSGEFSITVVAYYGTSPKETRDLIKQCILDFEKEGFTDEDLKRVKNSTISGLYGALESVASKSSFLTSYEMLAKGKKMNLQKEIDKYNSITKEQIWAVYNKYIKNKYAATVSIVRDPSYDDPSKTKEPYESINPYKNYDLSKAKNKYLGLVYNRAVDTFDRSKQPISPTPKPVIVPEFYTADFENGIKLIGTKSSESKKVTFSINIKGGHLVEDGKDYPHGVASLTAAMLNEGTQKYTSAEVSDKLAMLGSSIFFGSSRGGSSINISCYKEKIEETMEILEQKLFFPLFMEKEFKRVKKQFVNARDNEKTNTGLIAGKAFNKLMYGDESALGSPTNGNYKIANKISLSQVVAYHNNFYAPNLTTVVVVGNITKEEVMKHLSFLKSWEKKDVSFPASSGFPDWQKNQVFMVNKMYAKQSQVTMGYRALPYDYNGDYFKTSIVNYALGGSFNSRINLNLREEKGWTYGSRTGFRANIDNYPGIFSFGASIKRSATDSAIRETIKEIKNFSENGITAEELAFTKNALISSDALKFETSYQKAGFLYNLLERNLPKNYRDIQKEIVQNITMEEVNALAKKYLKADELIILVVGSEYHIKDGLEELGFGKVQTLDAEGDGKKKIYK